VITLVIEYVPFAAVVADALTTPACNAWTKAPWSAALSLVRVMVPAMVPAVSTVNVGPLLADPLAVTTTGPVEAPLGTGTTILVSVQLPGVAVKPLKVTVLVP